MTIWRLVEMVSVLSVAEMVTLKVPATVGDPETTPAAGATLSPGGRPDPPKPTGPVPPEGLHWAPETVPTSPLLRNRVVNWNAEAAGSTGSRATFEDFVFSPGAWSGRAPK